MRTRTHGAQVTKTSGTAAAIVVLPPPAQAAQAAQRTRNLPARHRRLTPPGVARRRGALRGMGDIPPYPTWSDYAPTPQQCTSNMDQACVMANSAAMINAQQAFQNAVSQWQYAANTANNPTAGYVMPTLYTPNVQYDPNAVQLLTTPTVIPPTNQVLVVTPSTTPATTTPTTTSTPASNTSTPGTSSTTTNPAVVSVDAGGGSSGGSSDGSSSSGFDDLLAQVPDSVKDVAKSLPWYAWLAIGGGGLYLFTRGKRK